MLLPFSVGTAELNFYSIPSVSRLEKWAGKQKYGKKSSKKINGRTKRNMFYKSAKHFITAVNLNASREKINKNLPVMQRWKTAECKIFIVT